MKKSIIAIALSSLALAGCATKPTHVTPSPVSGSKADGTVVMGYIEHGGYMVGPTIPNWSQAAKTAAKKCEVWGYSRAERFGDFVERTCQRRVVDSLTGKLVCIETKVTSTYQCVD